MCKILLYLTIILVILSVLYNIWNCDNTRLENFAGSAIDATALANIASLYNNNGNFTITNLTVTNGLTLGNSTTSAQIKGNANIDLSGNTNLSGTFTTDNTLFKGNMNINGNVSTSGNITASGNIDASGSGSFYNTVSVYNNKISNMMAIGSDSSGDGTGNPYVSAYTVDGSKNIVKPFIPITYYGNMSVTGHAKIGGLMAVNTGKNPGMGRDTDYFRVYHDSAGYGNFKHSYNWDDRQGDNVTSFPFDS